MKNLDKLFNPDNIAIIGVSENPSKIGTVIFHNIISSGYEGKVYIINPKHDTLFDRKVYNDIGYIQEDVDLAIIAIPGQFVKDAVKNCVDKKVKNIVIITAGFSELGDEGRLLEEEVVEMANKGGVNVLGPNCLGFLNPLKKMNASFAAQDAPPGDIAFVSQSGALCTMILDMAAKDRLGFAHFVSLGNKADINEIDLIKYWDKLDEIKVIGAYLEEIEDGDEFFKLSREIKKPLVILTPGKSEQAQKAISSHTGSIASSANVISALVNQSGIIQVQTPEELFNAMMSLSWGTKLKSNRVGIITNAGGPGVISTDLLIEAGFELPHFSDDLKKALRGFLPLESSVSNPVDLLGTAQSTEYIKAVETVLTKDEVDIIFVIVTPQLITQIEETAKSLIQLSRDTEKLIVGVFLGGRYADAAIKRMYDSRSLSFNSLEKAVNGCKYIWLNSQRKIKPHPEKVTKPKGLNHPSITALVTDELQTLETKISEAVISEFGIPLPAQAEAFNDEDLNKFVEKHGFPVVIKARTEDIIHKTEFKAVYLNIRTPMDLYNKFVKLQADVEKASGHKKPGVLIQEQVVGEELFIGIKRDGDSSVYSSTKKGFGHLFVFGKGGIYTEVYKDFAFGLVPFDEEEVFNMIKNTKVSKVLFGARGKKPLAYKKLIETIMSLQRLVLAYPEVAEMDINPLMITQQRVIAVDVKMFIKK